MSQTQEMSGSGRAGVRRIKVYGLLAVVAMMAHFEFLLSSVIRNASTPSAILLFVYPIVFGVLLMSAFLRR